MAVPGAIIVVDDEPDMLDLVLQLLERLNLPYDVAGVPDGTAALSSMSYTNVLLLITDHRMPGMDGLQLIQRARRLSPNLRAILLTAYADSAMDQKAMQRHQVDAVFRKPFPPDEFLRTVRSLLPP